MVILTEQELCKYGGISAAMMMTGNPSHEYFSLRQDLDISIGMLFNIDARYQLIDMLAPQGKLEQSRKTWSHFAGVRILGPGRDPGTPWCNYCYGFVMRCYAQHFPESHWRGYTLREQYNDETLGDIVEAILGVSWLCSHSRMACDPDTLAILNLYSLAIIQCAIAAEKVIDCTVAMGIWKPSGCLAEIL